MKLNVLERLIVLNLLPAEGSFANLKILRVVKEELSFDEKEHKALGFNQDGEHLTWRQDANVPDKDVKFGEIATQMVVKKLEEMDKKEELKNEHFSVYEKFMNK